MVAPQTRDVVTKVIAQSGSATADWALIVDKYRAQNTSRVYGQVLGNASQFKFDFRTKLNRIDFRLFD